MAAITPPTEWNSKLAARIRLLSQGHGRKSGDANAVSVGVAALASAGLRTLVIDETALALRALVDHRDDLVQARTQTVNGCTGCSSSSPRRRTPASQC
ncbi:MAG: IS110 family transposase [Actinomycetota bacterium]|nr:IS110 family transposase [Actinomycetota bacterium]